MSQFPHILAVGLNPAWQKTLFFDEFDYGQINRADKMAVLPAGKGINVARAALTDGARATVVQFAGGNSGECLLAAIAAEGIADMTVVTKAHTRVCTTILEAKSRAMTELIEPTEAVTALEVASIRNHIAKAILTCHGVAISGTFPPGVPDDFYADIIASLRERMPVVLDSCQGAEPALDQGPDAIKINDHELDALTGCGTDICVGIESILERGSVKMIAVTAGAADAYLGTRCGIRNLSLPAVKGVVSPLGAGDTATAVFLVRLCRAVDRGVLRFPFTDLGEAETDQLAEIFADGIAAASASCRTDRPAFYKPEDAAAIRRKIVISHL
jgi:fructose-1-phosphate kinase PfkB-like protein